MNQNDMILELLREGWTSPLDALREAGCLRFGSRIAEIRREHPLEERWHSYESRFGKKQYKEFRLIRTEYKQAEMFDCV